LKKQIKPNYSLVYSALSNCYTFLGVTGQIYPQETYIEAKKYAKESLVKNNQLSENYSALAYVSFWYE